MQLNTITRSPGKENQTGKVEEESAKLRSRPEPQRDTPTSTERRLHKLTTTKEERALEISLSGEVLKTVGGGLVLGRTHAGIRGSSCYKKGAPSMRHNLIRKRGNTAQVVTY